MLGIACGSVDVVRSSVQLGDRWKHPKLTHYPGPMMPRSRLVLIRILPHQTPM
jgi:hypothetical protein